jgi:uncharacterized protein YfaS (alpha-2-macroglobulin family)
VVEGLESVFRMPYGCFEQTSSCTYPNVLALDYLQRTRRSTPQAEAKARECIAAGYQRLLTFEVAGGGFDWFGHSPANVILTAYGVLEFTDMARVHAIDPAVIGRAKAWLFGQQRPDGSWGAARATSTWGEVSGELLTTGYVAWALAEARAAGPELSRALGYVQGRVDELKSAYEQALAANAFLAAGGWEPTGRALVERLAAQIKEGPEGAWAESAGYGPMLSRGASLGVEATALAALAFTRSGRHSDLARAKKALTWLARQKDAGGTWGTTQATILAIKALLAGSGAPLGAEADAAIAVAVNGKPAGTVRVTAETSDVLHLLSLTDHVRPGKNTVQLVGREGGAVPYQLVSTWWVPRGAAAPGARPLAIEARYDRTRLAVGEALTCSVRVRAGGSEPVAMPLVQLGLPPGFALDARALDALVERGRVARYELAPTHATLYLKELRPEAPLEFACRLVPRCAMRARIPASLVYEYYNPDNRAVSQSVEITVDP